MARMSAPEPTSNESPPRAGRHHAARWGKRLGVVAFMFFLLKGLAWLIVPAVIAIWAAS